MKLKSNWKIILKYVVIYVFVVICYQYIFTFLKAGDAYNFFGFSHAIRRGEDIYKDFNIITTPLYPIFMALGLYIYDDFLIFVFEQSLFVTIIIYFLEKILNKKVYFFLAIILLFSIKIFSFTYNILELLLMIVLYYLEKEYSNKDYLIGFIIGLCILTKHSIGTILIIPMIIICFNNIEKLTKRFVGLILPCTIFFINLIINKNLFDFINLCLLGLFDFSNKNSHFFGIYFFLSIFELIIILIFILKHKNLKYVYYVPVGFLFTYPLFDSYHFNYFFFLVLLVLIDYINIKNMDIFKNLGKVLLLLSLLLYFFNNFNYSSSSCENIKHFSSYYIPSHVCKSWNKFNSTIDKYCINKKCIILSNYSMIYNISHDKNVSYYDVLLYGNLGYNGTQRIISDIKDRTKIYIVISKIVFNDDPNDQFNIDIVNYVMNNYKKVDDTDNFYIYYKE